MPEMTYARVLGEGARKRHYHRTEKGKVIDFVVQLDVEIRGQWKPVIRYKSARHARMILSGIQIFKNLDSRCNHAGMTYYLVRENDILFLVFQKHELLHLFRNGSLGLQLQKLEK